MKKLLPIIFLFLFARGYSQVIVTYDANAKNIMVAGAPQDLKSIQGPITVTCSGFTPVLEYTSDTHSDRISLTLTNGSCTIPEDSTRRLVRLRVTQGDIFQSFPFSVIIKNPIKRGQCLIYEILNDPEVIDKKNAYVRARMDSANKTKATAKKYAGYIKTQLPMGIAEVFASPAKKKEIKYADSILSDEKDYKIDTPEYRAKFGTAMVFKADSMAAHDGSFQSDLATLSMPLPTPPALNTSSTTPVSLNGPNIMSNALEGIASFAVERSKQELNIAFFDKLNAYLKKNPEAKILFPSTLNLLNKILSFQFNQFLPKLRQSFYEDLNDLPDNISGLITLPKYQKLLSRFPEIKVAIKSISAIRKINSPQYHIAEIIDTLASVSAPEKGDSTVVLLRNYHATMQMINIISKAMLNPNTGQYYSREELDAFVNNPAQFDTLIVALNTEIFNSNITFYNGRKVPITISSLFSGVARINDTTIDMNNRDVIIRSFLQNVIIAVDGFKQAQADLDSLGTTKSLKTATQKNTDVKTASLAYMDAALHCVDVMGNVFNLFDSTNVTVYTNMVHSLFLIPENALNQDYPSLVFNTIGFVETTLEMCAADSSNNKEIKNSLKVIKQITTYGNLAANIIEAKTSADVMNAITAVALPPGSSSIKKGSIFNVSLQIYLGGAYNFWSNRYAYQNKAVNPSQSWSSKLNVTLPVGVSFNFGLGKGGSLGVMGMIMDLGAIAQYQITHDSTSSSSSGETFRLQNVFSPGVLFSYGVGYNLPLAVNFGWQYGPGLTSVSAAGQTLVNPSWRLLLSVVVDIPAFTIFNIAKGKKPEIQPSKRKKNFTALITK